MIYHNERTLNIHKFIQVLTIPNNRIFMNKSIRYE